LTSTPYGLNGEPPITGDATASTHYGAMPTGGTVVVCLRGNRRTCVGTHKEDPMNIALIIIIVIAIILAIVGGLSSALNWLLWVAIIVGVIALIAFLFRVLSGSNRT